MTDPQKVERTLAAMHSTGRRLLSLKEVVDAGRPAVYRRFGDELLYLDGILFDVLKSNAPTEIGFQAPLEDPRFADQTVGIEYGWRHALDCSCELCAPPSPAVLLPALRLTAPPIALSPFAHRQRSSA